MPSISAYATGEDISDIIAEKGKTVDTGSFSDTDDQYILAAFAEYGRMRRPRKLP